MADTAAIKISIFSKLSSDRSREEFPIPAGLKEDVASLFGEGARQISGNLRRALDPTEERVINALSLDVDGAGRMFGYEPGTQKVFIWQPEETPRDAVNQVEAARALLQRNLPALNAICRALEPCGKPVGPLIYLTRCES